ncbi:MAG: hypothetical protein ABIN97_15270 [Ginsengibacter sp.]
MKYEFDIRVFQKITGKAVLLAGLLSLAFSVKSQCTKPSYVERLKTTMAGGLQEALIPTGHGENLPKEGYNHLME